MPEGVGYGPQNIASVGLTLNIIGRHCYAYSGVIGVTSEVTLLEFRSPAAYIEAQLQEFNGSGSNDDIHFKMYMNDVLMYSSVLWNINRGHMWAKIIIPPYTEIKVTAENIQSGTSRDISVILEGIVYK